MSPHLRAAVAFKVAWSVAKALSKAEKVTPEFREFLTSAVGLVSLGTIADVVPLTGENRVLTSSACSAWPNRSSTV